MWYNLSMSKLSLDRIKLIPSLSETLTNREIAEEVGCCEDTVKRWLKRLRSSGYELPKRRMGRPPKKHAIQGEEVGKEV